MPLASELEEFGLEVEHEHHALVGSSSSAGASPRRHMGGIGTRLSIPCEEERSILKSVYRPRFVRPGILKWATLILALAIVVFHHLGQESDETEYVEFNLPEVEFCEDDNVEFAKMVPGEESCASYIHGADGHAEHAEHAEEMESRCNTPMEGIPDKNDFKNVEHSGELESRCNTPMEGISDENEFQKLLKHFCRKSCGLCSTEDEEEGVSEEVIEAEVAEIAEEIEEKKELEEETKEAEHQEEAQEEGERDDVNDDGDDDNDGDGDGDDNSNGDRPENKEVDEGDGNEEGDSDEQQENENDASSDREGGGGTNVDVNNVNEVNDQGDNKTVKPAAESNEAIVTPNEGEAAEDVTSAVETDSVNTQTDSHTEINGEGEAASVTDDTPAETNGKGAATSKNDLVADTEVADAPVQASEKAPTATENDAVTDTEVARRTGSNLR
eukprot:CAMPEP_0183745222 /NCGR_PEP_ID=MMETSP0737-20130205/66129_1 /TAXON_ID=385413 /ORGANISM="Thalassiosira miniscula, Strain CCMP1093" /LENGTH=441 /DNA_ID=CAMNT_0025980881 /DNA_START=49 /DNA_END=1375 /DNA_ORIENTATION=+